MWEKELLAKYGNKYSVSWTINPINFLSALTVDRRWDDENLTPKGKSKKNL